MRTAHQFILVVILSLFLAAVLLMPGRDEHVAVLVGEGRYKEAIALLQHRLAKAPGDPGSLAALGRIQDLRDPGAIGRCRPWLLLEPVGGNSQPMIALGGSQAERALLQPAQAASTH